MSRAKLSIASNIDMGNKMTETKGQQTSDLQTEFISASKQPDSISLSKSNERSFRSSLAFKATLLAVAIGTLPVLAVGIAGYLLADRIIIQQALYEKKANAQLLADKIADFTRERFSDIQLLANPKFYSIASVPDKEEYLNEFVRANRDIYQSIAYLDKEGNEIASSQNQENTASSTDKKNEDYFQQALEGNIYLSQPQSDPAGKISFIALSAPLKDSATKEIIGVVIAKIAIESLNDLFKNFDKVGRIHLIDRDGRVFISNAYELENERENENDFNRVGTDAYENFLNLAESLASFKSGMLYTREKSDGEKELLGYSKLPETQGLPGVDWVVLIETDLDRTFAAHRGLGTTFTLGTLISAIAIGAASTIIANRSIKPIRETATAVEKIGRGDLGVRLAISGSDELAVLGANTNLMADRIQQLLLTLHQTSEQLRYQNSVLFGLARNQALVEGNAKEAARAFTEAIARTLTIDRVSFWLYDEAMSLLACQIGYELASARHWEEGILLSSAFPNYFQALEEETITVLDDARSHPAIKELIESGQIPQNITAILNIPFGVETGYRGILRCERVENLRPWEAREQTFVNSVANLLCLSLENEHLHDEVARLLNVVSEVERGNLRAKAPVSLRVTGLVADTFNRLIENMAAVLAQVLKTARLVSQGVIEQKQLAQKLANNAELQALEVGEVLELTEQVQQKAKDSAQKAKDTNQSLLSVRATVEQGQQVLANLTRGITVLQQGTARMVQQMKTLGEFVGLADQFVQQQSQIALSTQVLAMNASLVAARAAEQQDVKQFAVVAREFESIANQISQLAQQTNEGLVILEQRSTQIHKVVSAVDADVQNLGGLVRDFTQGVEHSSQAFSNVGQVSEVAMQSDEAVVRSSEDIVNSTQLSAKVIRDIAKLASLTAEMTRESTNLSEEIDNLSVQLLQRIEFFHLSATDEGSSKEEG